MLIQMTEEQLRAEIALLHAGETAVITFAPCAGVPELMALATLAEEGQIVMDTTFPLKEGDDGWQFWHIRQRRFTATSSIAWERFLQVVNLKMVTRFEEVL